MWSSWIWFLVGFFGHVLYDLIWPRLRRRFTYWRLERAALPDGTRVRLNCAYGCDFKSDDGVWTTEWSMRGDVDGRRGMPNDYHLKREGGTETTFARRNALVVVKDDK